MNKANVIKQANAFMVHAVQSIIKIICIKIKHAQFKDLKISKLILNKDFKNNVQFKQILQV